MLHQRFQWSLIATSFSLLLLATPTLAAQALGPRHYGPIIEGYGGVFDVPSVDFITPTTQDYRAVFDVSLGADQPDQVNRRIETLARFLNMHGQAGVPIENMHLALVLHGTAGKDALSNAAYRERFGVANRNASDRDSENAAVGRELLRELEDQQHGGEHEDILVALGHEPPNAQ